MRPKLLEIEGLQSFTDAQRIDFEVLGETGIFGIFGPTGSGKSTILDAITFALYGRVKRAEGGTQGIINSGRNTARVAFTFELSREGGRRLYRVERTYQRKKNSPNSCEPKVARLIEIAETGEIPLCDKATEVSSSIRELIGLGNEDFTRAVVLPQNSFQEFLLLNNSERRGMLERIFYLEEYGKQLLDKLGRKMSVLKSRVDVLSGELSGYADASDEALELARKAMEETALERSEAEKEWKLSEARFNEAREVWGLVSELSVFLRREEELSASKGIIHEKRQRVEKANRAASLTDRIRTYREQEESLTETQKRLNEALSALPGIKAEMEAARSKYDGLKKEVSVEQPRLVQLRTRLADALGLQSEVKEFLRKREELLVELSGLNREADRKKDLLSKETADSEMLDKELVRLRLEMEPLKTDPEYRLHLQEGSRLENDIAVQKANITDLKEKTTALKTTGDSLEQRLQDIRAAVAASQKELDDTALENRKHFETKPGDRNSIRKGMERIHFVQGIYQILLLRKKELDQAGSRLALQITEQSRLEEKLRMLEKVRTEAEGKVSECRLEMDKASDELSRNAAYLLSKQLREGEPCPVCGSTSHPVPAMHSEESDTAALELRVEEAGKRLKEAEQELKSAERDTIAAAEQLRNLSDQNTLASAELEGKAREYEAEREKLPEKLRFLELDQVRSEVEKASAAYEEKLLALDAWEAKQNEFRECLQKLTEVLSGHKQNESGIAAEWKGIKENLDQLSAGLREAEKALEDANLQYTAFLKKYGLESVSTEWKRIAENDRRIHTIQQELEQKRNTADSKRVLTDRMKEELRHLNADQIRLEAAAEALEAQIREREAKRKELVGETNPEEEIRRIDARLEEYKGLDKEYQREVQILEKRHNELDGTRTLLENQKTIFEKSLDRDGEKLRTALKDLGFSGMEEAEASLVPDEIRLELKADVEEYDQSVRNIQAQKGMLQEKLNLRTITEEEWNRVNHSHAEWTARREDCISRSEIARSSYEIWKKKHDKWVEIGRGYAEATRKLGLYEQIGKILKAEHRKDNSFIDYIAEERLRYVAAKASETIGVMTKYRYGLELDTEAGFIIRDNANGGAHRMVSSLSGGETFLTSLSLALALSEQIQLKGQSPLEFFFLDEGFGTLDAELLDTVIDSLERLSSKERIIGLISHVPELKSRIGRRLVVQPPARDNEGSRVFIEKA